MIKHYQIKYKERGLKIVDNEVKEVLQPGRYWVFGFNSHIDILSQSDIIVYGRHVEDLAEGNVQSDELEILDLADNEYALIWVAGRLHNILDSGLYGYWAKTRKLKIEKYNVNDGLMKHDQLKSVLNSSIARAHIAALDVNEGQVAIVYQNGKLLKVLDAGTYAYWLKAGIRVQVIDIRDQILDISGQEIMTKDKVSLRINAILSYRVNDPLKAVSVVKEYEQTLYRDIQMALRSIVGTMDLDDLLVNKLVLSDELQLILNEKAANIGLKISRIGVKDIILPGDMKTILNQVTEARKVAEAAVIKRREETAQMRSQANTAKFLEDNPMLIKLKELEIMNTIAAKANLTIVTGEKPMMDQISHLM